MSRPIMIAVLAGTLVLFHPISNSEAAYYRNCRAPNSPSIPSGYAADYERMERAGNRVDAFAGEVSEYIRCLEQNMKAAADEYRDILDEWNRAVRAFNAR